MNNELIGLFAANRQKKEEALSTAEKRALAEKRDLEAFATWKDEVIAPELDRLAASVREQGWDAKVIRANERDVAPTKNPPSIGIYFAEQGKVDDWHPEQYAYVTFRVVPGHFKISVSESTIMPGRGGSSGSGVSIEFNKVDADFVRTRVENLLIRLLKNLP